MSFALYLGGALIFIVGLVYCAVLLAVPTQWIVAGAIVMVGTAFVTGVSVTRQKDKP